MPPVSQLLENNVNRLILINFIVYGAIELMYAGSKSGFELFFWSNPEFHLWQLFTTMFLHGNVMPHLVFNMFALWSFGRILEQKWGNQKFLFYYLACGVGASIVHEIVTQIQFQALYEQLISAGMLPRQIESVLQTGNYYSGSSSNVSKEILTKFYWMYHTPAVGASGAVYGLLVAFAMMFPNYKVMLIFLPVPVAAKYFVPVLLLIDVTAGFTGFSIFGSNIAHFAHIGGAIAGFLILMYWIRQSKN